MRGGVIGGPHPIPMPTTLPLVAVGAIAVFLGASDSFALADALPGSEAAVMSATGSSRASLWKLLDAALGPGAQPLLEAAASGSLPPTCNALASLSAAGLSRALRSSLGGVSTRAWLAGAHGLVHALLAVQAAAPAQTDADAVASSSLTAVLRSPVACLLDAAALLRAAAAACDTPAEALGLWLALSARLSAPHTLDAAPVEKALTAMRWERASLPGRAPESFQPRPPPPAPRPARGDAPASALRDDKTLGRRNTPPDTLDASLPVAAAAFAISDGALSVGFDQSPPLDAAAALLTLDLLLMRAHPKLHAHLGSMGVAVPAFAFVWLTSAGLATATGGGGGVDSPPISPSPVDAPAPASAFAVAGIPIAQTRAGARWVFATLIAGGWAGWARVCLSGLLAVAEDLLEITDAIAALSYLATFPRRGALTVPRLIDVLLTGGATPPAAAAALFVASSLRLTLAPPLGGRVPVPAAAYTAALSVESRVADARSSGGAPSLAYRRWNRSAAAAELGSSLSPSPFALRGLHRRARRGGRG